MIFRTVRAFKRAVEIKVLRRVELSANTVGNPSSADVNAEIRRDAAKRRRVVCITQEIVIDGGMSVDRTGTISEGRTDTSTETANQRLEVILLNSDVIGAGEIITLYETVSKFGLRFDIERIVKFPVVAHFSRKSERRVVVGPLKFARIAVGSDIR